MVAEAESCTSAEWIVEPRAPSLQHILLLPIALQPWVWALYGFPIPNGSGNGITLPQVGAPLM